MRSLRVSIDGYMRRKLSAESWRISTLNNQKQSRRSRKGEWKTIEIGGNETIKCLDIQAKNLFFIREESILHSFIKIRQCVQIK